MKRNSIVHEALGLDEVLLLPGETNVKPAEVNTATRLTRTINLSIPLIAAGHDNVTESAMAIAIAQLGGIGVIHDNMPLGKQVEEVGRVKRAEGESVSNPITIAQEASIAEAIDLMTSYKVSCLPVVEQSTQKVTGIITSRDIRFFEDYAKPVSAQMTQNVITVSGKVEKELAKQLLLKHRIEKLVVVDEQGRCTGLITVRDIERQAQFPHAARDVHGRLLVGAAVGNGKDAFDRTSAMIDAGLDVIFIDVAHAHTRDTLSTVSRIRQLRSSEVQIVVGNVATIDAARSLVDAGADAIKIGIGSCKTSGSRAMSGIGVPLFTAVQRVAEQCAIMGVPALVGGGVHCSSSLAKAIGAGAEAVVMDHLFAGTDEAPGQIRYHGEHTYKIINPAAKMQHRPLSSGAVIDPYAFDEDPVDTSIPYRGALVHVVNRLMGGLKSAMAYTGSKDIPSMIENAEFVRTK